MFAAGTVCGLTRRPGQRGDSGPRGGAPGSSPIAPVRTGERKKDRGRREGRMFAAGTVCGLTHRRREIAGTDRAVTPASGKKGSWLAPPDKDHKAGERQHQFMFF